MFLAGPPSLVSGLKVCQVSALQAHLRYQIMNGVYPFNAPLSFTMVPYFQMPRADRLKLWTLFCHNVMTGTHLRGLTIITPLRHWPLEEKQALLSQVQHALDLPPADELLPPHLLPSRDIPKDLLPPHLQPPGLKGAGANGEGEGEPRLKPEDSEFKSIPISVQALNPAQEVVEKCEEAKKSGWKKSGEIKSEVVKSEGIKFGAIKSGKIKWDKVPVEEEEEPFPWLRRVPSGTLPPPLPTNPSKQSKTGAKEKEKDS